MVFFVVTNVFYFIWFFYFFPLGCWLLSSFDLEEWESYNLDRKWCVFLPLFIILHLSLVILPATLLYNQLVFSAAVNKFVWWGSTHFGSHYLVGWLTYMCWSVLFYFGTPVVTCLYCDNNKQHVIFFSSNNYKFPREPLLKIFVIDNFHSLHWVRCLNAFWKTFVDIPV